MADIRIEKKRSTKCKIERISKRKLGSAQSPSKSPRNIEQRQGWARDLKDQSRRPMVHAAEESQVFLFIFKNPVPKTGVSRRNFSREWSIKNSISWNIRLVAITNGNTFPWHI